MKKPFKLLIESNGRFSKTKVSIDDHEIPCESIYVTGDRWQELTCVIALCIGKEREEAKEPQDLQPAIGFQCLSEDDYDG
jgi:hypothetical protein